jgi:hypothetical protein
MCTQCNPGLHIAHYSKCGRVPAVDALKQLDSSPASKCQTLRPVTASGYVFSDGDFECAQSLDHFVQTVATVRVGDLPRVGLGDGTAIKTQVSDTVSTLALLESGEHALPNTFHHGNTCAQLRERVRAGPLTHATQRTHATRSCKT